MSLSDSERRIIASAGTTPDPSLRRQAVAIVLGKTGADSDAARNILAESFLATTQPSFHLIPRGDAMASERAFTEAYELLAAATDDFASTTVDALTEVLTSNPETLAPLRMVLGLTVNEFAVAMKLVDPASRTSGSWLKSFERKPPPARPRADRAVTIQRIAGTVLAVMSRDVLEVPPEAEAAFHSKLDKRDTLDGWLSVTRDASRGVPYSALLYQRYVGGVWRQVQDAYSEAKGDALLEFPLATLLTDEKVPFFHAPGGAAGARKTGVRYGLSPGPDFVIPEDSPTVVIESKVGEDGGTVRDKASRIINLANQARTRGLVACALVDGKGWSERPHALAEVVIATEGRTYTLDTMNQLLEVPEIAALRGTGP